MTSDLQKWESNKDKYLFEQLKTTIALTSGTLIVSLSIINTNIHLAYKGVLYLSWALLINAIIFGILAFSSGVTRYDRTARGVRGELKGKEKELYDKGKVLTPFEAKTPNIHTWSFTLGLISFFIFVVLNVHKSILW